MKTFEKKYFSLWNIDFTANKLFAVFLLIVLISIYYHYRLFEHFVDAATTAATATAKDTEATKALLTKKVIARKQEDAARPENESSSKPLEVNDKSPLSVNDPGLFEESTLDKPTQSYIQKQVAAMVPAMMEPFDQMSSCQSYSKW